MGRLYKGKYRLAVYDLDDNLVNIFDNVNEMSNNTGVLDKTIFRTIHVDGKINVNGIVCRIYLINSKIISKSNIVNKIKSFDVTNPKVYKDRLLNMSSIQLYRYLSNRNIDRDEIVWILNYNNESINTSKLSALSICDKYKNSIIETLLNIMFKKGK